MKLVSNIIQRDDWIAWSAGILLHYKVPPMGEGCPLSIVHPPSPLAILPLSLTKPKLTLP